MTDPRCCKHVWWHLTPSRWWWVLHSDRWHKYIGKTWESSSLSDGICCCDFFGRGVPYAGRLSWRHVVAWICSRTKTSHQSGVPFCFGPFATETCRLFRFSCWHPTLGDIQSFTSILSIFLQGDAESRAASTEDIRGYVAIVAWFFEQG